MKRLVSISLEKNSEQKVPKKVKFDKIVKVILVPSKEEYNKYSNLIWYSNNECESIKKLAICDLRCYAKVQNLKPSVSFENCLELLSIDEDYIEILREKEVLKIAQKQLYQLDNGINLKKN